MFLDTDAHNDSEIQSAAILPLYDQSENIGFLVVSSRREYFFTARRRRLARLATEGASAIVRQVKARHAIRQRQAQAERLGRMKEEVTELLIEAAHPGGDWQAILDSIRRGSLAEHVELLNVREGQLERTWAQSSRFESPLSPGNLPSDIITSILSGERRYYADAPGVLAYPVVGADSVLHSLLVLRNVKDDARSFGLEEAEHQAMRDIAVRLASALAARSNRQERRELQEQIITAQRIGAAGLLGSMLMHQMLTPLSVIQRAIEELKASDSVYSPSQLADIIETRKNELLRQIRHVAERPVLGSRAESLRTIVSLAMRVLEDRIRQPNIEVRIDNSVEAHIVVDLWAIVGALVNLLSNALDAIGQNGTLWIVTSTEENRIGRVSIMNTGLSPSEDVLPNLFEASYTTKDSSHHLGLGLPLAKKAIESAHGAILFVRHHQDLCEVIVSLPLATTTHVPTRTDPFNDANG